MALVAAKARANVFGLGGPGVNDEIDAVHPQMGSYSLKEVIETSFTKTKHHKGPANYDTVFESGLVCSHHKSS